MRGVATDIANVDSKGTVHNNSPDAGSIEFTEWLSQTIKWR